MSKIKAGKARPPEGGAAREGKPAPEGALAAARALLARGDVRAARARLAEVEAAGPEPERAEARQLRARLAPDRGALLTAGAVLLVIALAAWAALLRR